MSVLMNFGDVGKSEIDFKIGMIEVIEKTLSDKSNLVLIKSKLASIDPAVIKPVSGLLFTYFVSKDTLPDLSSEDILITISCVMTLFYEDRESYRDLEKRIEFNRIRFSNLTIVLESMSKTYEQVKFLLKYITIDNFSRYVKLLNSVNLFPNALQCIGDLYSLVREDRNKRLINLIRSEEFLLIFLREFSSGKSSKTSLDFLSRETLNTVNCSAEMIDLLLTTLEYKDLPEEVELELTSLDNCLVTELNRIIEDSYKSNKEKRVSSYSVLKSSDSFMTAKEESTGMSVIEGIDSILEDSIPENSNPFLITKQEKVKLLEDSYSILLLKSENLNLVNLPKNIRVDNVNTVDGAVISSSQFDAVVLITKFISHAEYYRIRSKVSSKLILISSTNRGRILEDVFDRI